MSGLYGEVVSFLGSDALSCPVWGEGLVQCYGANTLAHAAIAAYWAAFLVVVRASFGWLFVPLFVLTAKEIFFDLPSSGFAAIVVLDSALDILTYTLTFAFFVWSYMGGSNK